VLYKVRVQGARNLITTKLIYMKNLFSLLVIIQAIFIFSCSDDNHRKQMIELDVLGLVLPSSANQSNKIILLQDGRTLVPVSGMSLNEILAGSKLLLSFKTKDTNSGITNIAVSNYSLANERAFTMDQGNTISEGEYTGIFHFHNYDSTINYKGEVSITFTDNEYTCTINPEDEDELNGSGNYDASDNTITFSNGEWPEGSNPDLIVDGEYNIGRSNQGDIFIWVVNSNDALFTCTLRHY
jgi:hypothetical protein